MTTDAIDAANDATGSTDRATEGATEGLTYAEALEELEDLLEELESSDVDVDRLTEQVARGVQLVRFCRGRLEVVTDEVDGVVAELAATESSDGRQEEDEEV